ncbi:MAG: twin-arginine translocase subunit TatC [Verrucomicrobiota bacterium]
MQWLFQKLFRFRESVGEQRGGRNAAEMPFLDHLEDFRKMILRIVITLLVTTLLCFAFKNQLMAVMRAPINQVWELTQNKKIAEIQKELAREFDAAQWTAARESARALEALSDEARAAYLAQLDETGRFLVATVVLARAVESLPPEKRQAFLDGIPELDSQTRQQVEAIVRTTLPVETGGREDLRMMGAFNPTEAFMLSLKLAFFAAIVLAFPLVLYFIMEFILPGLHLHERKALWPALAIGLGLFLTGALFAYFIVLPRVLEFFHGWGEDMGIANEWRIGYYITFATQFTLIFGLAFELPVVVMTFVKLGLLGYETMKNTRSYAVLIIFVVAAIITPTPDALTLLLLAGPMYFLYELCIWLTWNLQRKDLARAAEQKQAWAEREIRTPQIAAASHLGQPKASHESKEEDQAEEEGYGYGYDVDDEEEDDGQVDLSPPELEPDPKKEPPADDPTPPDPAPPKS